MSKVQEKRTDLLKNTDGEKAGFGDEIHLFLHCHLRGYDREGKGRMMDAGYYDKYGSPVYAKDSWSEGYFQVEKALAKHFNMCLNPSIPFPLVVGYGGVSHLYKPYHDESETSKPWNWTGWIPLQNTWISKADRGFFYSHKNRYFMGLRGNEIQNNHWDYDTHDEEEEGQDSPYEWIYDQISPTDAYRGGYWYKTAAWARYLHIVALKTHHDEPKRYNFIVHPLAYQSSLNSLPDASVDCMQWSIMNIAFEENFVQNSNCWGQRVDAIEVFNDFTYFFSWLPNYEEKTNTGYKTNNGRPNKDASDKICIVWFNTYPLEYCEFLIENALSRGVYLQILSANDAYYTRDTLPPNISELSNSERDDILEKHMALLGDPKGKLARFCAVDKSLKDHIYKKSMHKVDQVELTDAQKIAHQFLESRPYEHDTVFGYTSLIDTQGEIKAAVFTNDKLWAENLEAGEELMIDYLKEGKFFSHTGVYDIFDYSKASQQIPIFIDGQTVLDKPAYEITGTMSLRFCFAPVKTKSYKMIWSYTIEQKKGNDRETVHGYFKLNKSKITTLDLTNYSRDDLKWIRFTAFNAANTMRRAWFSPIRGGAFGKPVQTVVLPTLINRIAKTVKHPDSKGGITVTESTDEIFTPSQSAEGIDLTYEFSKRTTQEEEGYLYAYFAQGNSLLADIFSKPESVDPEVKKLTENSYTPQPERILQNIHGYFNLSSVYPTRLELKNSWDPATITHFYFYGINPDNCEPIELK